MDEIINISVNGYSLTKDGNVAGTMGDCNSTKLRITFAENWSEYAKSITFWNALGENPVKLQLGTDLLEDILKSYDVYLVPIPGEAMTEEGMNSFVIEGSIDGKVKRSVEGNLKVLYSPSANEAGKPASVTPDLATQLRAEMDAVKDDIAEAKEAEGYAQEAKDYAQSVKDAKEAIDDMTVSAETLEAGAQATVEKAYVGKSINMHFGIPAGTSGVYMGKEEPTDPDIKVWIDTSGSAEDGLRVNKLIVDVAEIYMNDYGDLCIYKPTTENEYGAPNLGGTLSIENGELLFNGMPIGAGGGSIDIKDLTKDLTHNPLTDIEKANFMRNTGLDALLGEMDVAIDEILEAQEALIGGDAE